MASFQSGDGSAARIAGERREKAQRSQRTAERVMDGFSFPK
jgi:hypothetical protein